jgi:hypothetical protein
MNTLTEELNAFYTWMQGFEEFDAERQFGYLVDVLRASASAPGQLTDMINALSAMPIRIREIEQYADAIRQEIETLMVVRLVLLEAAAAKEAINTAKNSQQDAPF